MAQDDEEKPQSLPRRFFHYRLWFLFFGGVLLIVVAALVKQLLPEKNEKLLIFQIGQSVPLDGSVAKPFVDLLRNLIAESNQWYSWGPDILRDLGIALIISVIATFVIEKYASDRLREDIARDVLSAAYLKVVPKEIFTQIADNVFRAEVYRKDWEVRVKEEGFNITDGIAIITADYSYELENLKKQEISHEIKAGIDLDVATSDPDIPKFTLLEFPLVPKKDRDKFLEEHSKPETRTILERINDHVVTFGKLTFKRDRQVMVVAAQVLISPRSTVQVRYKVKRAIRVPGDFVLNALVPADGIKIIIDVQRFNLEVFPLHPNPLHRLQSDTWKCEAGILPWQGFRFTAAPKV
jgi:hypothetical protein